MVLATPGTRYTKDYVPADFTDLYRHYYPFVTRLVVRFGIDEQEAEDAAQKVLMRFFETGALDDFNPEYETRYDGVIKKALFRSFLSSFVEKYVRHYRDRQQIHKRREGVSIDRSFTHLGVDQETERTWENLYGPSYGFVHEDSLDHLDYEDLDLAIRKRLARAQKGDSFVKLYDACVEQLTTRDRLSTSELAEKFGVTTTTIHNWLTRMRQLIRPLLEG